MKETTIRLENVMIEFPKTRVTLGTVEKSSLSLIKMGSRKQKYFTALKNGFQIYMDGQGINGKLTSMGCTGLTDQDIKDLELDH